jgi:hypothetical protein
MHGGPHRNFMIVANPATRCAGVAAALSTGARRTVDCRREDAA